MDGHILTINYDQGFECVALENESVNAIAINININKYPQKWYYWVSSQHNRGSQYRSNERCHGKQEGCEAPSDYYYYLMQQEKISASIREGGRQRSTTGWWTYYIVISLLTSFESESKQTLVLLFERVSYCWLNGVSIDLNNDLYWNLKVLDNKHYHRGEVWHDCFAYSPDLTIVSECSFLGQINQQRGGGDVEHTYY